MTKNSRNSTASKLLLLQKHRSNHSPPRYMLISRMCRDKAYTRGSVDGELVAACYLLSLLTLFFVVFIPLGAALSLVISSSFMAVGIPIAAYFILNLVYEIAREYQYNDVIAKNPLKFMDSSSTFRCVEKKRTVTKNDIVSVIDAMLEHDLDPGLQEQFLDAVEDLLNKAEQSLKISSLLANYTSSAKVGEQTEEDLLFISQLQEKLDFLNSQIYSAYITMQSAEKYHAQIAQSNAEQKEKQKANLDLLKYRQQAESLFQEAESPLGDRIENLAATVAAARELEDQVRG